MFSLNDDDLQSRFDALRRADEGMAPDLATLVARRRAHNRRPIVFGAAFAAAAVVLVVVGLRFFAPPTAPPVVPSILSWQSPTASLLQTPGLELLRTVPTLRSSLLRSVPAESLMKRQPGA